MTAVRLHEPPIGVAAALPELSVFIADARAGEQLAYFRGRLDVALAEHPDEAACRVRALAYTAWKTGYFDLLQQRRGEDDFLYILKRRHARETGR